MIKLSMLLATVVAINFAHAQSPVHMSAGAQHAEAEYYVAVYSQHYGVSAELVRAVIKQESNWNPRAVSSKGAMGYMQLMPNTAADYGVSNPFDPSENIGAGVHFLANLIQQFHGDLRLVLAAYNCGSRRIQQKGLGYSNHDVYVYVNQIRKRYEVELIKSSLSQRDFLNQHYNDERILEARDSQEGQQ